MITLPVTKLFMPSDDAFFFLWTEIPSSDVRPQIIHPSQSTTFPRSCQT